MSKSEFEIVKEFSATLGLQNQTDGSLFIYKNKTNRPLSTKPDGYYYYDGVTFILDAKPEGGKFIGQLEDYMKLESNKNFIGFKYNGRDFECYIKGEFAPAELVPKSYEYYKEKYFKEKINNERLVSDSAKKLADIFRDAKIDKQVNVPFIGAVLLCMRYQSKAPINLSTTSSILTSINRGISLIIDNTPLTRKQKKEFIQKTLGDETLSQTSTGNMQLIISEISKVFNFINISSSDYKGHDIMNNFLKVFRTWNSVNANEKGEVFTPDHIAQLMYKISKCNKDSVILDPTCGSGTFLTNAMANMFRETDDIEEKRSIKENNLIGIETNPFNATLAGINMMLHGDGASNIFKDDCFVRVPDLKNCYDRVLMNPPFSIKNAPELKFVYIALENMTKGGYLATIVPKSCVKGTNDIDKTWLKKIFEISNLEAVVSLPRDLFAPNAGTSTCILLLHKTEKSHSCDTLLVNCLDDGFIAPKGGQRIDRYNKWPEIEKKVLDAFDGKYDSYTAVKEKLSYDNELLFEAFSSNRSMKVLKTTFERYLREYVSGHILCGQIHDNGNVPTGKFPKQIKTKKWKINTLLIKNSKGTAKSIDRKKEDKFDLSGIPLIIAKKDQNGIGGMTKDYKQSFENKICIVAGGDGAGGKCYYCNFKFAANPFILICDEINETKEMDKYAKFYLSVVISERLYKTVGNGRTISEVPAIDIELPAKENGQLDIQYMSNYIKELEFAKYI